MGCSRGITTIGGTIDLHMAAPTSLVAKIDGAVVVRVVPGSIVFTGVEPAASTNKYTPRLRMAGDRLLNVADLVWGVETKGRHVDGPLLSSYGGSNDTRGVRRLEGEREGAGHHGD